MIKKITLAAVIILVSACSADKKEIEEAEMRYRTSMDSMSEALALRDSTMNELIAAFNDIESNLDSVSRKQNIIALDLERSRGDLPNVKTRINSQIHAINQLLDKNVIKVNELNKKLRTSNFRIGEFRKTITLLNNQILQKNLELEDLNNHLAKLRIEVVLLQVSVDTLSSQNYEQSLKIAEQTENIHSAYYIVGNSKELAEKKIIDKNGGLLGIGKSSKLNEEADPGYFRKIDYTQNLTIPINARKAKLITTHPFESYILDKENGKFTQMRIIKPDKFWSMSKYLVIATN